MISAEFNYKSVTSQDLVNSIDSQTNIVGLHNQTRQQQ